MLRVLCLESWAALFFLLGQTGAILHKPGLSILAEVKDEGPVPAVLSYRAFRTQQVLKEIKLTFYTEETVGKKLAGETLESCQGRRLDRPQGAKPGAIPELRSSKWLFIWFPTVVGKNFVRIIEG